MNGVEMKKKKFPVLLVYVLISLVVIGAATFYEIKHSEKSNGDSRIHIAEKKLVLKENESYQIEVDEELNGKLSFDSTDHSAVDVSSNGIIKGKKPGKAIIIIRDENNNVLKKVTIKVVDKSSKIKSDSNISDTSTNNNNSNNNDNNNENNNNDNSSNNNNSENNNNNNSNTSNNENISNNDNNSSDNNTNNNSNENNNDNNSNNENNNSNVNDDNKPNDNSGDKEPEKTEVYVKEIVLDKTSIMLFLNDSDTISATIVPTNAVNKNLVWSSSDSKIVTVNNGTVKGIKVGKATISVKASNGVIKKCTVEVKEKPKEIIEAKSITLNATSKTVEVGSSFNLTSTISPSNTTNKTISWTSSDTSIATVTNGSVKGIKAGTANITVKTSNGKTATCKVTVKNVNATGVSLNKTSGSVYVGSTFTLTATVAPSNTTVKTIIWTSNDTSIATVSNGTVKGIKAGTATITAKTSNGKTATCKVTVNNVNATGITLNKTSSNLNVGDTLTLTATISPANTTVKTITWSSNNTAIATVSNGSVKGIKAGTATITAKTSNGKTATCSVTVKNVAATGVSLNVTSNTIYVGSILTLVATISPGNVTEKTITWSSSNTSIATVSNGTVKGIKAGSATITAKTSNGKTATCTVNVKEIVPTGVTLDVVARTVKVGNKVTLTPTVVPSNAKNKTVTWSSNNTKIATVSNGVVTGVKAGIAIITVKTSNGKTVKATIVVLGSDATASFNGSTLKYWIQEPNGHYAMTHIWVKDAYNQMKTGLCNEKNLRDKKLSSDIINQEISKYNYQEKAMIGTDASSAAQIVIHNGKTLRDNSDEALSEGKTLNYIYGLDKNNKLRYFNLKANDIDYNTNLLNEIRGDKYGIKYTFSFRPALVGGGKTLYNTYKTLSICDENDKSNNARQAICQIDENNFLIITNTGVDDKGKPIITGIPVAERKAHGFTCRELDAIFRENNCQTAVNVDGGGSIVLFYKKRTNEVTFRKNSDREKKDVLYFVEK